LLRKIDKITIRQSTRIPQDLNPNPSSLHDCFWSFSFIGHAKDKEVYFLQQSWTGLVDMTETERDK